MQGGFALLQISLLYLQLAFRVTLALVERLALTLQGGNLLFQFRLVKQIGVAGEYRHILGKVHAGLLVHRSLVDSSRSQGTALQL